MKTISTFNAYHLGDNLIHLNFLRRLALAHPEITFTHTCDARHFAQLSPLLLGLPANNLQLGSAPAPRGAINAWRGADGWFYRQPDQHDFLQIHLRWFRLFMEKMGLGEENSPITCARDMLFDYPALESEYVPESKKRILIVNCPPLSGQWAGYNAEHMNQLARDLWAAGHVVLTVMDTGHPDIRFTLAEKLDVTAIGRLSINADCIIGCVTGPMWPCLNVWNAGRPLRVHLLDSENVTFTPNTVHANATSLVPEILQSHGYL